MPVAEARARPRSPAASRASRPAAVSTISRSPLPRDRLRRAVVERVRRAGEEIGIGERRPARQRDGEPQPAAARLEPPLARRAAAAAPSASAAKAGSAAPGAPVRSSTVTVAALGHADLVGADQIVDPRIDRESDAGLRVGGDLERDQQGMLAFEYIIHQPDDAEPHRHRILERPRRASPRAAASARGARRRRRPDCANSRASRAPAASPKRASRSIPARPPRSPAPDAPPYAAASARAKRRGRVPIRGRGAPRAKFMGAL